MFCYKYNAQLAFNINKLQHKIFLNQINQGSLSTGHVSQTVHVSKNRVLIYFVHCFTHNFAIILYFQRCCVNLKFSRMLHSDHMILTIWTSTISKSSNINLSQLNIKKHYSNIAPRYMLQYLKKLKVVTNSNLQFPKQILLHLNYHANILH